MTPAKRVVTTLPLSEIWNEDGLQPASRRSYIDTAGARDLIRQGARTFVVADVGAPLQWLHDSEALEFWRRVKASIGDPAKQNYLEEYPDRQFYWASVWQEPSGNKLIVFESSH